MRDAITPAHLRSEAGQSLESHLAQAGVKESSGEKGVNETPEEGEEQTVEKAKERTSIFRSFVGSDGEREVTDMQLLDTANAAVVKPAVTTALPLVPAQPAAKRKYGQHGIVAMMKKQQETATSAASASLLPQKVPGPAKSCNVGCREQPDVAWREPDLDESDEDECEGDDEADAEVDDEDEEEEEEDETEDDEEEDEDEDNAEKEGPAKKKSLNDVLSIKKNTLRLGTVDAGYLRSASITTLPCALILSTSSSTHACARARARTHTHARTHARTHAHAHTHTHTHTHTTKMHTHTRAESIVLCSCLVSILMKFFSGNQVRS